MSFDIAVVTAYMEGRLQHDLIPFSEESGRVARDVAYCIMRQIHYDHDPQNGYWLGPPPPMIDMHEAREEVARSMGLTDEELRAWMDSPGHPFDFVAAKLLFDVSSRMNVRDNQVDEGLAALAADLAN
jgi:hypothetical protein